MKWGRRGQHVSVLQSNGIINGLASADFVEKKVEHRNGRCVNWERKFTSSGRKLGFNTEYSAILRDSLFLPVSLPAFLNDVASTTTQLQENLNSLNTKLT